jgi:hypothetical protein
MTEEDKPTNLEILTWREHLCKRYRLHQSQKAYQYFMAIPSDKFLLQTPEDNLIECLVSSLSCEKK